MITLISIFALFFHQSDHLTTILKNSTFNVIEYYLYFYDKHFKFSVFH